MKQSKKKKKVRQEDAEKRHRKGKKQNQALGFNTDPDRRETGRICTDPNLPRGRAPPGHALGSVRSDRNGGRGGGDEGGRGQRAGDAQGTLRGRFQGRAPHPASVGSTMNVVHVFFLKILGIQLWGREQGVGGLQLGPIGHGVTHPAPFPRPRSPGPQRLPPPAAGLP